MTVAQLREILDSIASAHGDGTKISFLSKYASGKVKVSQLTGYKVSLVGDSNYVRFELDYPRGELIE